MCTRWKKKRTDYYNSEKDYSEIALKKKHTKNHCLASLDFNTFLLKLAVTESLALGKTIGLPGAPYTTRHFLDLEILFN